MNYDEGFCVNTGGLNKSYDGAKSPIKPAHGWANAPEGAKEFSLVEAGGFIRRPGLILQNEEGIYDHVEIYRSKKETKPLATFVSQPNGLRYYRRDL